MTSADKRVLIFFAGLSLLAVLLGMLVGCRGPDTFGTGVGYSDGDGTVRGPVASSPPKGPPSGPSSGTWDSDGNAWNVGAWVTWELTPRKVLIVGGPTVPPSSWDRPDSYEPPRPPVEPSPGPEPTPLPETATEAADEGEGHSGSSGWISGSAGATVGAALVLLAQYHKQVLAVVSGVFKGS
jgi:hypothetical protein